MASYQKERKNNYCSIVLINNKNIKILHKLSVLEEAMQFSTCVTKNTTPLKPQSPTISGWAQVVSQQPI